MKLKTGSGWFGVNVPNISQAILAMLNHDADATPDNIDIREEEAATDMSNFCLVIQATLSYIHESGDWVVMWSGDNLSIYLNGKQLSRGISKPPRLVSEVIDAVSLNLTGLLVAYANEKELV